MKKFILLLLISYLSIFNAYAGSEGSESISKQKSENVKDCFEGLNRGIFAFNQLVDQTLLEPVAKGYRKLPSPIKTGASNFLDNLSNLVTVPNNLLQGQIKQAGINTFRFGVNTTVGILGIFDAAKGIGFEKTDKEDYGQTLGKWGMGPGCYLVLPILGPSTTRDAAGSLVNVMGGDPWYNITVKNDTNYFKDSDYYTSRITNGVNFRSKNINSFDNLEKNSIDFYASIKSLYLQDRQQKILNSKKITDTMDDSDWEEIDTN